MLGSCLRQAALVDFLSTFVAPALYEATSLFQITYTGKRALPPGALNVKASPTWKQSEMRAGTLGRSSAPAAATPTTSRCLSSSLPTTLSSHAPLRAAVPLLNRRLTTLVNAVNTSGNRAATTQSRRTAGKASTPLPKKVDELLVVSGVSGYEKELNSHDIFSYSDLKRIYGQGEEQFRSLMQVGYLWGLRGSGGTRVWQTRVRCGVGPTLGGLPLHGNTQSQKPMGRDAPVMRYYRY